MRVWMLDVYVRQKKLRNKRSELFITIGIVTRYSF